MKLSFVGLCAAAMASCFFGVLSLAWEESHWSQWWEADGPASVRLRRRVVEIVVADYSSARCSRTIRSDAYGSAVTPNFHHLANQFVCLDNFYDSGDVSANGWPWSTSGRESDIGVKSVELEYAGRGMTYDYEGTNRNINVGLSSLASRVAANPAIPEDPNLLPGTADVAAPDGAGGSEPGRGYIWNAVLRAGKTVRNYGCFLDISRYFLPAPINIPPERHPFENKLVVASPTKAELFDRTDVYYCGFDQAFPDCWREAEWEREFDEFVKNNNLPSLSLVRLGSDHTGSFGTAIDEVNTPERQQADNDYAVGKLVEKIANSRYKTDTLIFILEDDAQSGEDHVDAHRSTAYVVGPYVKQGKVVSEFYTTVSMLRTIEEVLKGQAFSAFRRVPDRI